MTDRSRGATQSKKAEATIAFAGEDAFTLFDQASGKAMELADENGAFLRQRMERYSDTFCQLVKCRSPLDVFKAQFDFAQTAVSDYGYRFESLMGMIPDTSKRSDPKDSQPAGVKPVDEPVKPRQAA